MRTITPILLATVVGMLSLSPQGAHSDTSLLKDRNGLFRFFVVDKKSPPVQSLPDGPLRTEIRPQLGDVVFADGETDTHVSAGRFAPWTKIGWIAKRHLLDGVREPLTLKQIRLASKTLGLAAPIRVSSNPDDERRRSEHLFVRALTQPERQTRLGAFPGDASGHTLKTWGWHYIYDIEAYNNEAWILLGKISTMFGFDERPASSKEDRPRLNLVGWVPLPAVSLWATNIALELNTDKAAITFRAKNGAPARIFKEPPTENNPTEYAWIEPLKLLYDQQGLPQTKEVRPDPHGLAPEYPRLTVLDRFDGYTRVATGVSTTGGLTHGEIAQARAQKNNMRQIARAVDLVFLVDQSRSMRDDIEAVKHLLTDITAELHGIVLEDLNFGDPSIQLDVNVSVVGFDDRVFPHLHRTSLLNIGGVQGAFDRLNAASTSGRERPLQALIQVLKGPYLGEGTMHRFVILLTDEPGIDPKEDQRKVLAAMPDFAGHLQQSAQHVGWRVADWDTKKRKQHRTKILSLFTANGSQVLGISSGACKGLSPHGCYLQFLAKLGEVSLVTDHAKDLESVRKMFRQFFKRIRKNVAELALALEKDLADAGLAALPGVQKAEVDAIRRRAGVLSWEQLQAATEIAHIPGYVADADILGLQSNTLPADQLRRKPWRQRVLVSQRDLLALRTQTARLAAILDKTTVAYGWEHQIAKMRDAGMNERTANKLAMAELIVTTLQSLGVFKLAQVDDETGEVTPIPTRELAESLVNLAHANCKSALGCGPEGRFIALAQRAMRLPRALPFDIEGILSLPIAEVLKKDADWLHGQATLLRKKALGLQLIETRHAIPERPELLRVHKYKPKTWFFRIDTAPNVAYLHIPLSYIP